MLTNEINTRRQGSKFRARVEVKNFLTHVLHYNGSRRYRETNKFNPTSTDNSCPESCIEKDSGPVFGINPVFNLCIYPGKRMGSAVAPWAIYLPLCHTSLLEKTEDVPSKRVSLQQLKQSCSQAALSYLKSSTAEIFLLFPNPST